MTQLIFLLGSVLVASALDLKDTTNWLNQGLMKNKDPIDNRFDTIDKPKINLAPLGGQQSLACETPEGVEGKCVPPTFCKKKPEERDADTLFEYRELGCKTYQHYCCPLDQVLPKPKPPKGLPEHCGWTNPGGYSLRSSSDNGFSNFADFPWMVALLNRQSTGNFTVDYIGGGTLIHPSVVLTVAHKLVTRSPSDLKCRVGEWDMRIDTEILPHQERNVKKIEIHDKFMMLRAHYDAALLFMETPFVLGDNYHIGVACLARDMPAPDSLCYSMGWGKPFGNSDKIGLLKKIRLPLVDPVTCQRQLRNTRLGSNFVLHHSLTCAGGQAGLDTCVGDGGSSLVCVLQSGKGKNRYAVYGMVAYGVNCGKENEPGVYAKVPEVVSWVNRIMDEEKLDKNIYSDF